VALQHSPGERKGVIVQDDCARDDLEIFHLLYAVTAQRDGFTGRPLHYFQKLWDALVPKDMAGCSSPTTQQAAFGGDMLCAGASVLVCLWRQ
jgi:hypothetical protein